MMRSRHKVPEVTKEPPESALEDDQPEDVDQLVISVQTDDGDPSTIVLVPMVYGSEILEQTEANMERMVDMAMEGDDDDDDDDEENDARIQVTDCQQLEEEDNKENETTGELMEVTDQGSAEEDTKDGQVKKERKKRPKSSFICHYCGYKAQSNPALRNHVLAVHEKLKPYLCDICGYAASAKPNLDMHKAIKHNTKKNVTYSCEECDYKCSNDQHLKAHVQIVHVESLTPFECGVCQYQCRKRCLVIKHMKIVHEKSKPFPCSQCPRAFSANCILLRHVEMVHEKVRPFACDVCGYAFAERRFLHKHIRAVHDKSKPYECKKCDYKCAMRDSLVRHNYNKHERKEKFKCRLCAVGFRKRSDMEEHYKNTHETPFKPYACEDCSYATDKKPRLEKHILMEHTKGEHNKYRNLKCSQCPETFTQHTQLSEHCVKVHGTETKSYVCDGSVVQQSKSKKRGRGPSKTSITQQSITDDDIADDESDVDWKQFTPVEKGGYRTASSRRVKRPKTFDDYITPFPKREPEDDYEVLNTVAAIPDVQLETDDGDNLVSVDGSQIHNQKIELPDPDQVLNEQEDHPDIEEEGIDFPDNAMVDEGDDTEEIFGDVNDYSQLSEDLDSQDEMISPTTTKQKFAPPSAPTTSSSGAPRSIKFTVRTKGQTDDQPVELEIEIKDPGFMFNSNVDDRLQNDAQAVVNFLSDGAVVDAIMSIEKKQPKPVEEDSNIKKIDETNNDIVTQNKKGKRLHGGRRTFLCDMCGYACTSRQTLNTHYAYKHGNLRPECYQCDDCDYKCDLMTQLNCHKQIVHKDGEIPFACNLCPQQYKTEGDLDRHLRAIHLDERPFVCNYCKHGFNKKSNLIKHVKMVHERVRPYQCDQCDWNFGEKRDLQSHVDAVHKKIKPFVCEQCDFKCARATQLRVHLSNVHRVKPTYDCETCGHRFVNKAYLRSHIRSVHEVEVKRYQCGYCDFSSVTKLSVDRHMTTHTKEKRTGALAPLFCSYCGDTFPNHSKLTKHVKMDHGATAAVPKKVYECSSCDYKAGTHSLLKAHVRSVHENERRFKCELCDFTSFAKSAMKRHISAIHEKLKPFACDHCDFRSSYKESLDLHLASVHKTGDLPKRILTRKLKKQPMDAHKLDPDSIDLVVTEVDNMLEPLDSNEDTVEVSVPLVSDGVMHLGEVTVITATGDDSTVYEIQH